MSKQLIQDIKDEMLAERLEVSTEEVMEIIRFTKSTFDSFVDIVYNNNIKIFNTKKELVHWLYDHNTDRDYLVNTIWDMYENGSLPYDKEKVYSLKSGKVVFVY